MNEVAEARRREAAGQFLTQRQKQLLEDGLPEGFHALARQVAANLAGFRQELEEMVSKLPGVTKVWFFGSASGPEVTLGGMGESPGKRFRPGRSDLDVVVEGQVSADDKVRIDRLIQDLNRKYSLGLEDAPYMHPTPFYVEGLLDAIAFREAFDGHLHLVRLFRPLIQTVKKEAPTYRQYWAGEDVRAELGRITPVVHTMFAMFS